ncbi:MipA/OmpV family protein [Stenotrophomonas indicatrix]|jgi:outer membrane protein
MITKTTTTVLLGVAALLAAPAAQSADLWGDKMEATLGAGVLYGPLYAGSDESQAILVPVLSVQRGILFFDSTRGAGLQYQFGNGLYLSQSVYYDLGRLEKDSSWRPGSDTLKGMGRVPGSVTTKTMLVQPLGDRFNVSAEAEYALRSSAHRLRYRLGTEAKLFNGNSDDVFLTADVHGGDRDFNQAYYGVSTAQAATTGRRAFSADSGINAYAAGVRWEHKFGERWMGIAQINAMRYAHDVSGSSVIERRNSVFGNVALTYTY